jgi:hypothetical protein
MKGAIDGAIAKAFVFGFRIIMLICAGLSLISAGIAWEMIPKDRDRVAGDRASGSSKV